MAIFVPPLGVLQVDVADAICAACANGTGKTVLGVLMGRAGLPEAARSCARRVFPPIYFPRLLRSDCRRFMHMHSTQRALLRMSRPRTSTPVRR
jgi:hypothetical protein